MKPPVYRTDAHHAKRKYAYLHWFPDARFRGPHGRRHERSVTAWMMGWAHEQNETESGDPVSTCPWTKRAYASDYADGRRCWRHACGGGA